MDSAASILVQMALDTQRTVITEWGMFLLARRLFLERSYRGMPIPKRNGHLTVHRALKLLSDAIWDPALSLSTQPPSDRLIRDQDFLSILYTVCDGDAARVMLDADPFCYLSHASALAAHRLAPTPSELHVSTPERSLWSALARTDMTAALGIECHDAEKECLPFQHTRPQPKAKVRGVVTHRHGTRFPLPRGRVVGSLRVTPIGESFRETLTDPGWCGGMPAIVALWRTHASSHLDAIIGAIAGSSEKIVRVRAGYLLEEVLGVDDPRIHLWVTDAQRGSSRKLDPTAAYAPRFSARWMLSINVQDPTLPATEAS